MTFTALNRRQSHDGQTAWRLARFIDGAMFTCHAHFSPPMTGRWIWLSRAVTSFCSMSVTKAIINERWQQINIAELAPVHYSPLQLHVGSFGSRVWCHCQQDLACEHLTGLVALSCQTARSHATGAILQQCSASQCFAFSTRVSWVIRKDLIQLIVDIKYYVFGLVIKITRRKIGSYLRSLCTTSR